MSPRPSPVFDRLRRLLGDGPLVVAHRGASRAHPENTLAAFRAATAAGVPMQEFDVQCTRDGVLVCVHDTSLDRTTDAASKLGPGALVAHTTWAELQRLDAGAWLGAAHAGERVPTLADAIGAMLPASVPLIEHKAGEAARHVATLREVGSLDAVILQSFDWVFVRAAHELAPTLALAVLGPTPAHAGLDAGALAAARACGAGMVHWHDRGVTAAAVRAAHDAGLLVCTYTTDDELGFAGGAWLGVDAMCTNEPIRMQALRAAGTWRAPLRPGPRP